MTTYAGLTLIDHYLKLYRLNARLKKTLKCYGFKHFPYEERA
jgi:hypothetical protein